MASQDEATKLKLRALELKKAGDIAGAKAALAKARDLEFQDVTADQLTSPADLKRLAVTLKKRGDIAGAKAALVKAKQIEAGGGGGSAAAQAAPSSSPEPEQRQQQEQRQRPPTEGQQLSARFPCLYNTASAGTVGSDGGDDGAAAASAAAGASKDGAKQQQQQPVQDAGAGAGTDADDGDDDGPELDDSGDRQGWTDEEMMDEDTMTEMKAMGMADDVPSEEDYQKRIQDSKRAALACKKGGDIAGAKRGLIKAKKLEAVMIKLYHDQDEDEDDDEDYSLLDELNDDGDADGEAFFEEMFGDDGNTLDLDDLDHLDAPMLKDMMESGMDVPDVDHVRRRAQEKKELAVALHKDGNAEGAKAALSESKRLQARADQLAEMLEAIESGALDEGDDMEALEAMLAAEDGGGGGAKPKASKQAAAAAATAVPEEPMKSADEYKLDAVRLKKENKLSEAATALRMYKKALAKESSAAEAERRKEIVQDLRNEIALARDQEKLFAFYERFVDTHAGMAQLSFWKTYARDCAKAAKAVETRGSNAIDIMRTAKGGAMRIDDEDDLDFVGRCIDPSDMRLEVAILDVLSLSDNKHLKRELRASLKDQKSKNKKDEKSSDSSVEDMPSIRVDVTVQLPPSEKKPDDNISFTYEPTISEDGSYEFGPSHHADIPRGGRFFKTILRRMARKRIQITVYLVPPKKKGLFGKRPSTTETSLGTVVLELKDFLEANFVAGDFPLMDSLRRNELGGVVRLGVRTGVPYDPEAAEGFGLLSKDVDVQPYESMSFLSSSSGVGF